MKYQCPLCPNAYNSKHGFGGHFVTSHRDALNRLVVQTAGTKASVESVTVGHTGGSEAEDEARESTSHAEAQHTVIVEKDAEIARLKEELGTAVARLAETPGIRPQPTDEERFAELVEDLSSLTPEGKSKLGEATGWIAPNSGLTPTATKDQGKPRRIPVTFFVRAIGTVMPK